MRFSHRGIADNDVDLGIERTSRNDWAKTVEGRVRELSPLPISYDVDCTQELYFSEFSYTEFLGGILLGAQNMEINCKLRKEAMGITARQDHLEYITQLRQDKYVLTELDTLADWPQHVGFMVGHNMFDLVSPEVISRIAFENKEFVMKLHPLTNDEYAGKVAQFIGWDRIVAADISGVQLLENCEVAYVTTATELCALAVAKGKRIVNISSFFHEAGGAYYSINTFLFRTTDPRTVLNNLIDCPFSGIIFPWMTDIEQRVDAFYSKMLELREQHAPVASRSLLRKIPTDQPLL